MCRFCEFCENDERFPWAEFVNFRKIQKSHALCNSRRTTRDETRRSDPLQGIARRTTHDGRATRGAPRCFLRVGVS